MKQFSSTKGNLRHFVLLSLLTIFLFSCAAKIGASITVAQQPLPDTAFVLVLQTADAFSNDGIEIGTIKSGDNGLSTNCTYYEVIDRLRALARQSGANLIKITKRKAPDQMSTCERITATIYKVPDFRKHEKEIEWSANRKLAWEDFKAVPKSFTNPNVAAQTYCGFSFQTNYITLFSKTKIFTRNIFSCNLSWVSPNQMNRPELLEHEQGHFDLCEIYTRKLRRRLAEQHLTIYNLSNEANTILKDITADYLNRQELYEQQTNYSLDTAQQHEWTKQISTELYRLDSYSK